MTHDARKNALRDRLIDAGVLPVHAERAASEHEPRTFTDGQGRIRSYSSLNGDLLHPFDEADPLGALADEIAGRLPPTAKGGPDRDALLAAVIEKQKKSGIYGF